MITALSVLALCAVAGLVAALLQRRAPDAPSQPLVHSAPHQLDRADFARPDSPWLVVLFSSATCNTCVDMGAKVGALESPQVAVEVVEASENPDIHSRYGITGVPVCVVADAAGVVRRSFVGPATATHLWAAVAELREPGSVPPECGAGE